MEVPLRLVRREVAAHTADAFLLFADGPAPLAAACVRLAGELPTVFPVRGGFLLVPRESNARPVPGTVRLRRAAGDLFAPTDAELLPTLLPDEVTALTRDRGLIVLPGGAVLAFDVNTPLPIARWLAPAQVQRDEWRRFPPRPDLPDALNTIERPVPPTPAAEILTAGAPEDARPLPGPGASEQTAVPEDARPRSGSFVGRTVAGVGLATAGFLAWLGRQLGAGGLARLGGDLARRAMELVPRLSERLLGEQEAALRDVLRELQSGDIEKALRRAPPAVADPDQPARIDRGARLAPRDPRYSLRDLVGRGGGATSVWLGGGDVWDQLAREYRRLAAEAAARGDHRRAAYLYGVLLRDLRAAANALLAGGLYRDAALLFRDKLNDPRAAADAFEHAGEYDEALRLYDRLSDFERAGDLLRRLGDEERAVGYYARAADRLASEGRFYAAGDLIRTKAYRRDVAIGFYRRGWLAHDVGSMTCAERLIDEHALANDQAAVEALWSEAEIALVGRSRDAGQFFNYVLWVGEDFLSADARADLADRARLVFATHLHAHATIGEASALVGELFPVGRTWGPPVGRDAAFAARNRRPELPPREHPGAASVRIAGGTVTAVAVVRGTFDLVVAATDGIFYWRVSEGRVVPVWDGRERVTALSASARGEVIFAVSRGADELWRLRAFAAKRTGAFRPTTQYTLLTGDDPEPEIYLQPAAVFRDGEYRVAVAMPDERHGFAGPYLKCEPPGLLLIAFDGLPVRLYTESGDGRAWYWGGERVFSREPGDVHSVRACGAPFKPASNVDWLAPAPGLLEVAAVDEGGCINWAEFDARDPAKLVHRSALADHPTRYTTACLIAPGVLAAATDGNEVHWLRVVGKWLIVSASVRIGEPARVFALAPRPDAREVVAVLTDGHAVRLVPSGPRTLP